MGESGPGGQFREGGHGGTRTTSAGERCKAGDDDDRIALRFRGQLRRADRRLHMDEYGAPADPRDHRRRRRQCSALAGQFSVEAIDTRPWLAACPYPPALSNEGAHRRKKDGWRRGHWRCDRVFRLPRQTSRRLGRGGPQTNEARRRPPDGCCADDLNAGSEHLDGDRKWPGWQVLLHPLERGFHVVARPGPRRALDEWWPPSHFPTVVAGDGRLRRAHGRMGWRKH
mmetsp:Transcript_11632/g.31177  ORF Transcript_11632/g.31177 Transcript_11632/m.31177 type:complete len:227 (+) Transcript_11632:316-996(+)